MFVARHFSLKARLLSHKHLTLKDSERFFHSLSHRCLKLNGMLMARVITRRFFLQSFVVCKSTSASESIQTEFELNKSDVSDSLRGTTFAASKRGSFFQEAPRLRNQFSCDLFLQSYLKRILPIEVELLFDILQFDRYGQLIHYKSVSAFFSIIPIFSLNS